MTVLITGAAGFYGSALVRAFAVAGEDVIAYDTTPELGAQRRPDTPYDRVRYVQGSTVDREALKALPRDIDAVVHVAALSLPNEAEMAETIVDANLFGTANLLNLATTIPTCKSFLYISSAGVYDQGQHRILRELDADGGNSLYGACKVASEALVHRFGAMFPLDVGVLRPTSLYGPGEIIRPTRPFTTQLQELVDLARRGEPARVINGHARCDWIYVDDCAEAAVRFVRAGMRGRVLNLSSGRSVPFSDVVEAVKVVFGLEVRDDAATTVDGNPDRAAIFSNEALVAALGWAPPRSLEAGLRDHKAFLEVTAKAPEVVA